jgi:hypothetical protein
LRVASNARSAGVGAGSAIRTAAALLGNSRPAGAAFAAASLAFAAAPLLSGAGGTAVIDTSANAGIAISANIENTAPLRARALANPILLLLRNRGRNIDGLVDVTRPTVQFLQRRHFAAAYIHSSAPDADGCSCGGPSVDRENASRFLRRPHAFVEHRHPVRK